MQRSRLNQISSRNQYNKLTFFKTQECLMTLYECDGEEIYQFRPRNSWTLKKRPTFSTIYKCYSVYNIVYFTKLRIYMLYYTFRVNCSFPKLIYFQISLFYKWSSLSVFFLLLLHHGAYQHRKLQLPVQSSYHSKDIQPLHFDSQ